MNILTEEDQQQIGERVKEIIIDRTRRGVSSSGQPFQAKKDGSPSNLVDTGQLLDSLQVVVVNEQTVEVVAQSPYASFVEKDRPFMGLTSQETDSIALLVAELMAQRIKEKLDSVTK